MKANDIQTRIFKALSGIEGVSVFDDIPEEAGLPFIVIGDDSFESVTRGLYYVRVSVEVYGDDEGYRPIKDIAAEIVERLSRLDGFIDLDGISFERYSDEMRHAYIAARYLSD